MKKKLDSSSDLVAVVPSHTESFGLSYHKDFCVRNWSFHYLFVKANKTAIKLRIHGDTTLIVDNVTLSNTKIVIEPGGNLKLYVIYAFSILSNSEINPPCRGGASPCASPSPATVVRILGIETTTIAINNSDIWGGIYGPASTFSHYSGGELYGSVVALSVDVNGGGIHIDKGFSASGGGAGAGNIVY